MIGFLRERSKDSTLSVTKSHSRKELEQCCQMWEWESFDPTSFFLDSKITGSPVRLRKFRSTSKLSMMLLIVTLLSQSSDFLLDLTVLDMERLPTLPPALTIKENLSSTTHLSV